MPDDAPAISDLSEQMGNALLAACPRVYHLEGDEGLYSSLSHHNRLVLVEEGSYYAPNLNKYPPIYGPKISLEEAVGFLSGSIAIPVPQA